VERETAAEPAEDRALATAAAIEHAAEHTPAPAPAPAQERRSRLQSPGIWEPWSAGTVITYELMPTKEDGEDGVPAMGVPARRGVRRGN
jgi:hypothetical protein